MIGTKRTLTKKSVAIEIKQRLNLESPQAELLQLAALLLNPAPPLKTVPRMLKPCVR